jgi:hypothetical protein
MLAPSSRKLTTRRITGLMLVGLVLLLLVGEGPPNPFKQPPSVQAEFLAMFLMLTGFLVGWRWEALGGFLAVGGFALFCATELAVNGRLPGGAIPFFVIPGSLLLTAHGLAIVQRRSAAAR